MNEDDIKFESRLINNESAIKALGSRFTSHEHFVHKKFDSLEAKVSESFQKFSDSHERSAESINKKIDSMQTAASQQGKISWPLIVSICSILMAIVGWGMVQQQTGAVNQAVTEARYDYQGKENAHVAEWNRRLGDRLTSAEQKLERDKIELLTIIHSNTKDDAILATKVEELKKEVEFHLVKAKSSFEAAYNAPLSQNEPASYEKK